MKKTMQKPIGIFLSLLMALSVFGGTAFTVGAENEGYPQLRDNDQDSIYFSRDQYELYDLDHWVGVYNVIAEATEWPNASRTDLGYKVSSTDNKTATLMIPNMAQMFKSFWGSYNFSAGWAEYLSLLDDSYTYGWAGVTNADGSQYSYIDCNPYIEDGGLFGNDTLHYDTTGELSAEWPMSSNVAGVSIGTKRSGSYTSTNAQYTEIQAAQLQRRVFANDLRLLVHTANDDGGYYVRTVPYGCAVVTADSDLYASLKPTVTLVSNESGVDPYGKLYVGSKIRVSLKRTAGYAPYEDDTLSPALYLTRANGSPANATVEAVDGTDDYIISLIWDGMTQDDLSDTYTVNVVMTRKQNLKIDLTPSVAHLTDDQGNETDLIDPEKIGEAVDLFWSSGSAEVLYAYSDRLNRAPYFSTSVVQSSVIRSIVSLSPGSAVLTKNGLSNVQWVNFRRDADDRILYNGHMYAGNEKIILDAADFGKADLTFSYYNKDSLTAWADAKAELAAFVNAEDYRVEEQTALAAAIAEGNAAIEEATSPEEVAAALATALAAIAAIPTDAEMTAEEEAAALAAAKAEAKDELDGYRNANDYREAEQADLAAAIAAGKTAIDDAESIADVEAALANAKTVINSIPTDAELTAEEEAAAAAAAANQAAADAVIGKINAIGTVEYTEASKSKIDDAQNAYDALTDAQKALVTNAQTLENAIARYAALKAEAEQAAADQGAAAAVIAKINNIGTVEYTNASKAKIDGARTAYNGLTQTQKALVENFGVLEAAEARYAELKAAAEAPTNPDQPSGGSGKCKWCGEDHSANFWQRIVGFWHTIFYFWAHLFGLR